MDRQTGTDEFGRIRESVELTYHSLVRAHERLGLNREEAERTITRAYAEGMGAEEFNSREKKYLEQKGANGAQVKVYNGCCYVFSENAVCITVFQVPLWFGKRQFFDGKTKIRNPKNYYRHYGVMA